MILVNSTNTIAPTDSANASYSKHFTRGPKLVEFNDPKDVLSETRNITTINYIVILTDGRRFDTCRKYKIHQGGLLNIEK